jgi:CheY-like chemotaxis protein
VGAVVSETLELVRASLPHALQLHSRLDTGDAAVLGDPTQIHQVVMNLCANAVQATKAGSITVATDAVALEAARVVATSTLPPGRYVRITVEDTGTGIAPDVLERAFDPFFTTKEVGVGTGLGLSLVHGIATDLGGGIAVESTPGVGSAFSVFLPWHADIAPQADDDEPVENGRGQTVMLVDDEEPLVRLGEEMLAQLGYEPVGFTSGLAALQAFRDEPGRFQAVLTDESMPDMTGSELLRRLLALQPGVPVVLMSGDVTPQLAAHAREAGAAQVLNKPLVSRDIARSLREVMRDGNSRLDGTSGL